MFWLGVYIKNSNAFILRMITTVVVNVIPANFNLPDRVRLKTDKLNKTKVVNTPTNSMKNLFLLQILFDYRLTKWAATFSICKIGNCGL